jgi:hypothetical protein
MALKVGTSFGRCVRDIVTGVVKEEDVWFIVAGTRINNEQQVEEVMKDYASRKDYLIGLDIRQCTNVAQRLWNAGKIHQPRMYGKYPAWYAAGNDSYNDIWRDCVPSEQEVSKNPMVKEAWDEYRATRKLIE